jgi:hypothetical protein
MISNPTPTGAPLITAFLTHHAGRLSAVKDRATLATWHAAFAEEWVANSTPLADSANATFGLTDDQVIRPDVGYLAVESDEKHKSEQTWILVSVNPGWSKSIIDKERVLKGEDQSPPNISLYQSFREQFFPRWYRDCVAPVNPRRGQWWNNALNFLHDCANLPRRPRMADRDSRLDVIGWELWPMHSTKDGLSALAHYQKHVLAQFARASIDAALRFQGDGPRRVAGIVLASPIGFDLLATIGQTSLVMQEDRTIKGIRVRRYEDVNTRQQLWAIRRQMFSKGGMVNADVQQSIVQWIQRTQSPVATASPAASVTSAHPNVAAAAPVNYPLYNLVRKILKADCQCVKKIRKCPDNCHTWNRDSNSGNARAMVRKPGHDRMVHLNFSTANGDASAFKAALRELVGNRFQSDERSKFSWRIGFWPNLDTDTHVKFLEHWLPRTSN